MFDQAESNFLKVGKYEKSSEIGTYFRRDIRTSTRLPTTFNAKYSPIDCEMKRKRKSHSDQRAAKRHKTEDGPKEGPTWPLLRQYYPEVLTLRNYLASKLCNVSRNSRKKILRYGIKEFEDSNAPFDPAVTQLLDTTVVGSFKRVDVPELDETIEKDILVFTQQVSESSASISPTLGAFKQSEVRY